MRQVGITIIAVIPGHGNLLFRSIYVMQQYHSFYLLLYYSFDKKITINTATISALVAVPSLAEEVSIFAVITDRRNYDEFANVQVRTWIVPWPRPIRFRHDPQRSMTNKTNPCRGFPIRWKSVVRNDTHERPEGCVKGRPTEETVGSDSC